jgi:hypothetical protein
MRRRQRQRQRLSGSASRAMRSAFCRAQNSSQVPCDATGAAPLLAAAVRPRRRARAGWELQAGDASAKPGVRRRTGTAGGFDVVTQRSAGVRVQVVERIAGVAQGGASLCCCVVGCDGGGGWGSASCRLQARRCTCNALARSIPSSGAIGGRWRPPAGHVLRLTQLRPPTRASSDNWRRQHLPQDTRCTPFCC